MDFWRLILFFILVFLTNTAVQNFVRFGGFLGYVSLVPLAEESTPQPPPPPPPPPYHNPLMKRGIGAGFNSLQDFNSLRDIRWFYNWGPDVCCEATGAFAQEHDIDFVPMQWGKWRIGDLDSTISSQVPRIILTASSPPSSMLRRTPQP
jgi:Glycosyl hydrolase catalytic core